MGERKEKNGVTTNTFTLVQSDQPSQMWLISITQLLGSFSTSVADAAHLMLTTDASPKKKKNQTNEECLNQSLKVEPQLETVLLVLTVFTIYSLESEAQKLVKATAG